jgi:phage terminase large subunit
LQTPDVISTGYKPRKHQQYMHANMRQYNVLVCHRRLGKTILAINEIIDRALRCTWPNPQYAYIAPTYSQAKRIAWKEFKKFTARIPGAKFNESDLRVEIPFGKENVITILLLGAENPGSLRGIYLDGVVLDEYAEMDPAVWTEVLLPALSDRNGWAVFIGTFKGVNHYYRLYQKALKRSLEAGSKWFVAKFKASETKILPKHVLEEARQIMSEEEYNQEYECEVSASLPGAYYGKDIALAQTQKRVTQVPWEPSLPVYTGWDLGLDDATAVWFFQMVGAQPRVIDYLEVNNKSLEEIDREFFANYPYQFGGHYLPHDVEVRDMMTKKSRKEGMKGLLLAKRADIIVVPRHRIEDRIDATRNFLKKCWFDAEKCAFGLECLSNYERVFDRKANTFKATPRHNWASHGADAFGTFVMGYTDMAEIDRQSMPDRSEIDYDMFGV